MTDAENGSISITGTVNGVVKEVTNGEYVDYNTALTVTLTPEFGYVVDADDKTDGLSYVDGDGTTSDDKTYTLSNVKENTSINHSFSALGELEVTYSVVDVKGDESGYNGKVLAKVTRKSIDSYTENDTKALTKDGNKFVYEEGKILLTAQADAGYVVKQWVVDGEIYKENDVNVTANALPLTYVELNTLADKTITVQFVQGDPYITYQNPENGTLSAKAAGADFASGGQSKAPVIFEVVPNENYEVKEWQVNGVTVDGETENTFTYTSDGINADISVVLWGKILNISANAEQGGTVQEVGEVRYNTEATVTATPDSGYTFDGWYLNDEHVSNETAYTFTATADGAYTAQFKASENNPVNFSVNDADMGSISATVNGSAIESGDSVVGGKTVTFTVSVNESNRIVEWTGLPKDAIISTDKLTAMAIVPNGGLTVQATLEAIPTHSITITPPNHGTITAQVEGEDVTSVVDGT